MTPPPPLCFQAAAAYDRVLAAHACLADGPALDGPGCRAAFDRGDGIPSAHARPEEIRAAAKVCHSVRTM